MYLRWDGALLAIWTTRIAKFVSEPALLLEKWCARRLGWRATMAGNFLKQVLQERMDE
jgi:hypothetical protein